MTENIQITSEDLRSLLDILECGVTKITFDGDLKRHVLWANKGFYALTGHGKEGYDRDFNDNPHKVLHADDIEWVFARYGEHAVTKEPLTLEYRVIHRDGHVVWLLTKSSYIGEENGFPVFMAVMIDVTEAKELRDSLAREEQRYALVNSFSSDILFEYETATDTVHLFGNAQQLLGYTLLENFRKNLSANRAVHNDDLGVLTEIADAVKEKTPGVKKTGKFRLRYADGEYQWCYIIYDFIKNGGAGTFSVLGKVVNVHDTTLEIEELKYQSSLDSMTRVYNKASVENVIKQALSQGGPHALLIVDIDDFKTVNDDHGHAVGDAVIEHVAQTLQSSFRTSDVIGRIGGDEFIVLVKNAPSGAFVRERLDGYMTTLRAVLDRAVPGVKTSTSIGAALFPKHADNYYDLFLAADAALYEAKQHNKGGFVVCGRSQEHACAYCDARATP